MHRSKSKIYQVLKTIDIAIQQQITENIHGFHTISNLKMSMIGQILSKKGLFFQRNIWNFYPEMCHAISQFIIVFSCAIIRRACFSILPPYHIYIYFLGVKNLPADHRVFCYHCLESFTSKKGLVEHLRSKHDRKLNSNYPIYRCNVCSYVSQNSHSRHKRHKECHQLSTVYRCNRCMFLAPTYAGMRCHHRKTHCTIDYTEKFVNGVSIPPTGGRLVALYPLAPVLHCIAFHIIQTSRDLCIFLGS